MSIIIVTGGCGFIGSHVARAFKFTNHNNIVHIVDRVRREHTLKYIDNFIHGDYADPAILTAISDANPDVIVHCAGTSLVGPSVKDPGEYYNNNVCKTITLLNFLNTIKKKPNIIFSSSASVYGEPEFLPIPETHKINPISPYGNTKAIIETILKDYYSAYGINSTCFRYFNAAGAFPVDADLGQEPGATHLIAKALEASLSNSKFTLNGNDFPTPDGTCIRDYIHVMDLAIAHLKAAEYMIAHPGSHIFNLGTNQGNSNLEIINYISNKYGPSSMSFGPKRDGDPAELISDATKAKTLLQWEPKHSNIYDIIDDAYKWYCR